jgi:uncharacterized heparinase superfamily protein
VKLKHVLRQIQPNRANLVHGRLPLSGRINHHQSGTSMPFGGRPPHHSGTRSSNHLRRHSGTRHLARARNP